MISLVFLSPSFFIGVGLSLDTGASIGVNGVSASFLGTGFSIGPSIGIKTPFFDFSFNLF
jgi:hypothetical protein